MPTKKKTSEKATKVVKTAPKKATAKEQGGCENPEKTSNAKLPGRL
jgi:hypothetical protein